MINSPPKVKPDPWFLGLTSFAACGSVEDSPGVRSDPHEWSEDGLGPQQTARVRFFADICSDRFLFTTRADKFRPATSVVYAADIQTGVYRSTDAGQTWIRMNDGLRTRAVKSVAISADGMTLYAATEGEGVFRIDLTAAGK